MPSALESIMGTTQGAGPPPPPPGFVPVNAAQAAPPPPPGFVPAPQQAPSRPAGPPLDSNPINAGVAGYQDASSSLAKDWATWWAAAKGSLAGKISMEQAKAAADAGDRIFSLMPGSDIANLVQRPVGEAMASSMKGEAQVINPAANAVRRAVGLGSYQPNADDEARNLSGTLGLIGSGVVMGKMADRGDINPRATAIAETTPREAMIDENGALTPDGVEASINQDIPADHITAAYDAAAENAAKSLAPDAGAVPVEPQAVPSPEPVAQVPPASVEPPPQAAPEPVAAPVAPSVPYAAEAAPADAAGRIAEAQSLPEPVPLTKGQATQDIAAQTAEHTLQGTNDAAALKMQQYRADQQAAIKANVEQIQAAYGDPNLTPEDRGGILKNAVTQLRNQGAAGVRAKYQAATDAIGGDTPVVQSPILDAADEVIINRPVDPGVRTSLETALAKYGMLPGKVVNAGRYTIITPEAGAPIRIVGDVEPLTLGNAEQFRQQLNSIYSADKTGATKLVIRALDDSVDQALADGATGADAEKVNLSQDARAAFRAQKQTFAAKDIVQRLADVKAGTDTDVVTAERGIREVLGSGPDDVTNLRRIKSVLLSKPTPASVAAWKATQAQGLADIFDKAETPVGDISGAKLTTAINQFGRAKLKILLEEPDFNALMKVERVTRNATVPLPGTVNYSGSGYVMQRFLAQMTSKFGGVFRAIPVVGPVAEVGAHMAKSGFQDVAAAKALNESLNFGPKEAAAFSAKSAAPQVTLSDFKQAVGDGGALRAALGDLAVSNQRKKQAAP